MTTTESTAMPRSDEFAQSSPLLRLLRQRILRAHRKVRESQTSDDANTGLRLVHGACGDSRGLWAHAWVDLPRLPGAPGVPGLPGMPGGLVFDGVCLRFYGRDGYRRVLRAVAEATYDSPAMLEYMRASRRYGPWHTGVLGRDATRRHARSLATTPSGAAAPLLLQERLARALPHQAIRPSRDPP